LTESIIQFEERMRSPLCDFGFSYGKLEIEIYIRIGAKTVGTEIPFIFQTLKLGNMQIA